MSADELRRPDDRHHDVLELSLLDGGAQQPDRVVATGSGVDGFGDVALPVGGHLRRATVPVDSEERLTDQRIHMDSTSTVSGPTWPNGCHVCEVELDPQTGEVQMRSLGLMQGYYKDEARTRESLTPDGWLRTGDKGRLDGIEKTLGDLTSDRRVAMVVISTVVSPVIQNAIARVGTSRVVWRNRCVP